MSDNQVIPEAAVEAAIELQAETQEHIRHQVIPEAAVDAAGRAMLARLERPRK